MFTGVPVTHLNLEKCKRGKLSTDFTFYLKKFNLGKLGLAKPHVCQTTCDDSI